MRPHLQRLRERLEPLGLAPAEALALLILLAGAASLTAVVWWSSRPAAVHGATPPVEVAASAAPTPGAAPAVPTPATPQTVVVHVAGHVTRPGVVRLPGGARVDEAIQAAGGATASAVLDGVNLARTVSDGEQIRVPGQGETIAPPDAAVGQATPTAGPLDLNAATAEQLQDLPGIGPVMAERIIQHRTAIGGFAAVTQLLEVPGIGPARFQELQALVTV